MEFQTCSWNLTPHTCNSQNWGSVVKFYLKLQHCKLWSEHLSRSDKLYTYALSVHLDSSQEKQQDSQRKVLVVKALLTECPAWPRSRCPVVPSRFPAACWWAPLHLQDSVQNQHALVESLLFCFRTVWAGAGSLNSVLLFPVWDAMIITYGKHPLGYSPHSVT